jgi:Zn-dependent M32 family carboxypeptidase
MLLNSIYVKVKCNRLIEGLEQDNSELDINEMFKRLEDKINKIQEQVVEAQQTNENNAETLKTLKK